MRDPRKYTRSLIICQSAVTITYIVIGIVVYYFCGSFVASPALGSAGVTMKKICYGLALPGLLVTVTIVSHVSIQDTIVVKQILTTVAAAGQVHLHPTSKRISASYKQLVYPLGCLAQLHWWLYLGLIRYRQRNSGIRRSRVPDRSTSGNPHVLPTNGLHVVIRQLEPSKARERHQVAADGGLERICHRHWYFSDDRRHLRLGRRDHVCV